jgi:hypothetical protein
MNLGPFALHWLHQQTSSFREKYIRSMVNIAAPWGGAIKALRLIASGDNIDVRHRNIFFAKLHRDQFKYSHFNDMGNS